MVTLKIPAENNAVFLAEQKLKCLISNYFLAVLIGMEVLPEKSFILIFLSV